MAGNTQETIGLELERTIPATPEQVFDAWTRPEQVSRWFSPSSEYTTVVHALDPRLGGSYRIEMRHASGKVRKHRIRILAGDRVSLEISPYDVTRARINYRHKDERPAGMPQQRRAPFRKR